MRFYRFISFLCEFVVIKLLYPILDPETVELTESYILDPQVHVYLDNLTSYEKHYLL